MTAIQTTTTTTTSTSSRSGTQLTVGSQANTQSVGTYVTDVNIQPYINPTIISFFAYNMRPNILVHVFFDAVLVDMYCAPGVVPTSFTGSGGTASYDVVARNGDWGTPIYTDDNGQVAGQFNVPAASFKTGDRKLQVADIDSLVQGTNAITTIASAMFTASNLSVTRNAVTLTTVNPTISHSPISDVVIDTQVDYSYYQLPDIINVVNNVITNTQIITLPNAIFSPPPVYVEPPIFQSFGDGGDGGGGGDPLAQALTIRTPIDQSGVFVTSLDLFFQEKSLTSNNGVMVYLCEIDNGYPNTNCILPFSTTHVNFANITSSNVANVSTNFKFEAPVFLNTNKEYAFVIVPDAADPDYTIWTANIGDIDVTTGYQVFSQPLMGTAFYGATQGQWTALQTEYIKFNLRRATFKEAHGDAFFYNSNTDYLYISGIAYSNTTAQLLPGDYVYGATSTTPDTANAQELSTLSFFDNTRNLLYVENSTGKYSPPDKVQVHRFANASVMTPNTTTMVAYADLISLYNPIVDALVPQIASITPPGTALSFSYAGTSNTYGFDALQNNVQPGNHTEFFDKERIISSLSNEMTNMAGAKSFKLQANLTTTTSWVSPLIDLVRDQQLVIANKIDPVGFKYEEFLNFSNTQSKYVSKIVTLAAGQDAEDLSVSLTAHRPPGTDVTIWAKFLAGEDADSISQKTWTPLINQAGSIYSDPSNPQDFKEMNFVMPSAYSAFATVGTISANSTSPNVAGVGTNWGSDQLKVGYWINMAPNTTFSEQSRQIIQIVDPTKLILNQPFTRVPEYINQPYYIVVPPTTAYKSVNNRIQMTGTVATSLTNNAIVGTGTNFVAQFAAGTILWCANDQQVVVHVTNATYLTVGSPWLSAVTGANVYTITPTGVTYLNSNNALYNTFKQFQVKIVLQSNDSSKVPYLDDLRCLALQL